MVILTFHLYLCLSAVFWSGSSFLLDMDNLTAEQWTAIAELRDLAKYDLTEEYMKEDYYLAKWLAQRDINYNVNVAYKLLKEDLLWRKQENISTILLEDWADLSVRFPYSRNTTDKCGRPVLYIDMGEWTISDFLSEGESSSDRLARYITMFHEESEAHVRQIRAEGGNVTQFNMIVNVAGYNSMKHACIQCLYLYRNIANSLTLHFPKCVERTVFLNVPYLFKMVYLFFSEETQRYINIFGQDKNQWEAMLLEYIDSDQIPAGVLAELSQSQRDNSEGIMTWNREL